MGPTYTLLSQNMSYLYSTQYSMSIYLSNLSSLSIPLTHWVGKIFSPLVVNAMSDTEDEALPQSLSAKRQREFLEC